MKMKIAPIRPSFLDLVRREGIDDLGQPVKRVVAEGGEPCRDVLRRAVAGEALILASYSPFAKPGPYREFGPVFVLATPDIEAVDHDRLPMDPGADSSYLKKQFVLRAYGEDESILDAVMVTPGDADLVVERLLSAADVAFIHARFPLYGCFAARIERG